MDVGAQKDLVAAKSQVETAKSQLLAAKAQVQDAAAAESAAKTQVTYTVVKSPIAGVVAQRYLNVSDSADTTTPIAQVVDLSQVLIEASLPTTQPAKVTVGQTAEVKAKSLPAVTFTGTVHSISPVTDNQGTTVGVRIFCSNPKYDLKEGMPVTALITTAVHPNAMVVPQTALVSDPSDPDKQMVYVFKDGKVNRVPVTTGIVQDGDVEVLSGLTSGETIVSSGAYGVPDGTEVEPQSGPLRENSKVSSTGY